MANLRVRPDMMPSVELEILNEELALRTELEESQAELEESSASWSAWVAGVDRAQQRARRANDRCRGSTGNSEK